MLSFNKVGVRISDVHMNDIRPSSGRKSEIIQSNAVVAEIILEKELNKLQPFNNARDKLLSQVIKFVHLCTFS